MRREFVWAEEEFMDAFGLQVCDRLDDRFMQVWEDDGYRIRAGESRVTLKW